MAGVERKDSPAINESADFAVHTATAHERRMEQCLDDVANLYEDEEEKKTFQKDMAGFKQLFSLYIHPEKQRTIDWDKIKPPPEGMVVGFDTLDQCSDEEAKALLNKLVVLKLNGGLGTSMGCTGPKSAITVHSGYTFLDLTVRQIEYLNSRYDASVPLVLMNSFNTHTETDQILQKYKNSKVPIKTFNQHRYPRIWKDSLRPCPDSPSSPLNTWYPPGHGDVFSAFYESEVFAELRKEGKEFLFLSNVDNLGATVDFRLLQHLAKSGTEYIMEVTDKTKADIKGGTLIDYEGKARLLEIAQVPKGKEEEFKSVKKFKIFNTNNLWVSLAAVERLELAGAMNDMDIIANPKELNGKDIVQLERACGAAIQYFSNACGVNVPRSRFLPVKGTSDLFIVQSNLYALKNGTLRMNPKRPFETVPLVKLGPEFKKVTGYMDRIANIPDVLELDHLTISGDVTLGKDVTLRGTVIIVANHGSRIDIPSGAVLENKVVSGNLRILDH